MPVTIVAKQNTAETSEHVWRQVNDGCPIPESAGAISVAALLGVKVLHLFGVSLDAFMVAGGGLLAWLGFAMLRGLPPGPNMDSSFSEVTRI